MCVCVCAFSGWIVWEKQNKFILIKLKNPINWTLVTLFYIFLLLAGKWLVFLGWIYWSFCLNCFLKMTGDKESTANTPNNSVDRREKASDELAMVFSVWPAWIAKNDGGATPVVGERNMDLFQIHYFDVFFSISCFSTWDFYLVGEYIRKMFCFANTSTEISFCWKNCEIFNKMEFPPFFQPRVRFKSRIRYSPKNVPNANGYKGTPITGATRLMNQFGKNGVMRRNRM